VAGTLRFDQRLGCARPERRIAVSLLRAVEVPRLPVSLLEPVIGASRYELLARGAGQVRHMLAGRTIWNVNSTAAGGGVAEMLQVLVGYVQDLDIAIGWLVITGDAGFFAITKRLHNQIHGSPSGPPLGARRPVTTHRCWPRTRWNWLPGSGPAM
jgi:trehalose synthase